MYISHNTGEIIPDELAFRERAAFRTLTWKGTSWVAPDFGSDVVPFLFQSNLRRSDLQQARTLIEQELAKDSDLYQVTEVALAADQTNGTIQVFLDDLAIEVT